jgi:hypothetical protein
MASSQLTPNVPTFPHPGIRVHVNGHGNTVLRLHYEADPEKGGGKKVFIPEINRHLSPWAASQFKQMTDPNAYLREYEIEAEAALGRLVFNLDEEATCEMSFPIPQKWTRRMALDPHPSVPHAMLWVATDPWGDRWYYRELWPSRACYRWDDGRLFGIPGPCPDDEPVMRIKDYVETMQWLESAKNPQNIDKGVPFDEKISARVIDYAARAFGKGTNDDQEQPNFQQRFEQYMCTPELRVSCPVFEDAKKDHDVGFEMVNAGLKPRLVQGPEDKLVKRSRIHIFRDRCPELLFQLKNIRRQQLTPQQALSKDPTGKPITIRAHMADDLRYLEMANPVFRNPVPQKSNWKPRVDGIAY